MSQDFPNNASGSRSNPYDDFYGRRSADGAAGAAGQNPSARSNASRSSHRDRASERRSQRYDWSDPDARIPNDPASTARDPHSYTSQDASQDFARLCNVISESISQASAALGRSLGDANSPLRQGIANVGNTVGEAVGRSLEDYRQKQAQRQVEMQQRAQSQMQQAMVRSRFRSPGRAKTGAITQTWIGGLFSLSFGGAFVDACVHVLPLLPNYSQGSVTGVVGALVMGGFTALSVKATASGVSKFKLTKKLKIYRQIIGNREAVSISELAQYTNDSKENTLKALRTMIQKGWIPEGHIDDEQTTLIVTNAAFAEYLKVKQMLMDRQREEMAQKRQMAEERAKSNVLTPDEEEFLAAGYDYLAQIGELNTSIQDETVSAQVLAIEDVVEQILVRAKEEPDVIAGLGKLMNYYLPTTVKLLTAYNALDDQTVQGENIMSSKEEIEQTLDVLYNAYEKLLDATFLDMSMDVSSDITVLHTVLAQEGLIDSPFKKE